MTGLENYKKKSKRQRKREENTEKEKNERGKCKEWAQKRKRKLELFEKLTERSSSGTRGLTFSMKKISLVCFSLLFSFSGLFFLVLFG